MKMLLLILLVLSACHDRVLSDCVPESWGYDGYMVSALRKAAAKCKSNKILMRCLALDFCQSYSCITTDGQKGHRIDASYTCGGT